MMMAGKDDRLWILLARRDDGSISPEELAELEELLGKNNAVNASHAFVEEVLNRGIGTRQDRLDARSHWKSIADRMEDELFSGPVARVVPFRKSLVAACIALLVAGGILGWLYWKDGPSRRPYLFQKGNLVTTQMGSRSKLVLPDGTRVWLNAGSKLSYNDFNHAAERRVSLSGEAYFEVVHDSLHPFIVHTAVADITDIGTSFGVKAYPDESRFEATLIEGSIEVTDRMNLERKILLKPDEKLIIPVNDSLHLRADAKTNQDGDEPAMLYKIDKVKKDRHGLIPETAWIQNKMVFDNEPFGLLSKRMERWYNVKIHIEDSTLVRTPFSGIIEKETIEQALQAMRFSSPFFYKITGNDIWITKQ